MSIATVVNLVLIAPLLVIYDAVFHFINSKTNNPGFSIILFSLVINFVLLPLYYQMERFGRKSSETKRAMMAEIKRIKKHYKGRERYYYIQTIHRTFSYNPISMLVSFRDLYLQILVFATVYIFLANHIVLKDSSFGMIKSLGQPDHMLFGMNLLPIVMTLANILSAFFYSKDKSKRHQAFILAGLFLLVLYNSPSGLVLYWTCNNLISLLKNLIEFKVLPYYPSLLPGVSAKFERL